MAQDLLGLWWQRLWGVGLGSDLAQCRGRQPHILLNQIREVLELGCQGVDRMKETKTRPDWWTLGALPGEPVAHNYGLR